VTAPIPVAVQTIFQSLGGSAARRLGQRGLLDRAPSQVQPNRSDVRHASANCRGAAADPRHRSMVAASRQYRAANPLDVVRLTPLMDLSSGRPEIMIGLVDGPVDKTHPDLVQERIRELPGTPGGRCVDASSAACSHGTFVAGMFSAKRGGAAAAICPDCTLVVRPIFPEQSSGEVLMPSATPDELAFAIVDCVKAGVRVLNLSSALTQPSIRGERKLEDALAYAMQSRVIVVAAAGNQGSIGSSAITRHPAVLTVTACETQGRPLSYSNLGHSIGRRGLSAPAHAIAGLAPRGKVVMSSGTSTAAPFVAGAVALVWSLLPGAYASQIKLAITKAHARRRASVVPPLLDAWATYRAAVSILGERS
jgi:subtilisin family serine protease